MEVIANVFAKFIVVKRLLLISFLVLCSCSKDSEEESAITPGDEIIGTHQIIDISQAQTSILDNIRISGTISFESNKKGSVDFVFSDIQSPAVAANIAGLIPKIWYFDWSFDGQRWKILGQDGYRWTISFFDYYDMRAEPGQVNSYVNRLLFY